ncbi:MAG: TolC family protein [Candidatus Omnitrophica bacterium]|nr:TolC family protein [Candidatus Omnitrophota bacterium]
MKKLRLLTLSLFIFQSLLYDPLFAQAIGKDLNHCLIQARIQYDNSNFEGAVEWWQRALAIDPGNQEAIKYIKRAQDKILQAKFFLKPETPEPVFEVPTRATLSLQNALEVGVKNHLPVKVAKEQMDLAHLKEREVFRELFPAATLRWDESKGVVSSQDYKGRKYQVKMQHPLYSGGELENTWQQAKVNLKIAQENFEKTKADYAMELIKAYYDYVKAIRDFSVHERVYKDLEGDLAMAKKEHEAGTSTLVDFLNVQSQYNQAYYAYLSSQNSLSLAKLNFLQLMNLDRDPAINIKVDTELVFKDHSIDLEKCIELAYENRTDLKIKELELKSAEYGERISKSKQMPKIDLTGSIGRSGEVFTPGQIEMSNEWFLGAQVNVPWGPNTMSYSYANDHTAPSLTTFSPTLSETNSVRYNILDNLSSYTEAKSSLVTKEQALSDLLKSKQTAAAEVREAYFNYQESVLKVKNSLVNKDLYEKELTIVKEKRLIDEATTQDIVGAKMKLATEETNYNAAMVESILALEKLNKAIGISNYFK